MTVSAGTRLRVATWSITAITRANPCVMTIPGHTMIAGDFFFVTGVSGMTQVNFRWFNVASVSGDLVTLNDTGPSVGRVVSVGALDSSAFGVYTSGGTASPQLTRGNWTWDQNLTIVKARVWGSGAAGGGSTWTQFGAAGGSGGYAEGYIPRPASGVSTYIIDRGMPGVPAGILNTNYLYAGPTAFGLFNYTPGSAPLFDGVNPATDTPVTVPTMTGDCWAHGAGIGQRAGGTQTGGDGGTPGVSGGTYAYITAPGGQGGASIAAIKDFSGTIVNSSFPAGAVGAGGGAMGGNNGQDGQEPGGGGAGGNNNATVNAGFACSSVACPLTGGRENGQSGAGGPGMIVLEKLLFNTLRPLPPFTQQAIDPQTGLLTQSWYDYLTRADALMRALR